MWMSFDTFDMLSGASWAHDWCRRPWTWVWCSAVAILRFLILPFDCLCKSHQMGQLACWGGCSPVVHLPPSSWNGYFAFNSDPGSWTPAGLSSQPHPTVTVPSQRISEAGSTKICPGLDSGKDRARAGHVSQDVSLGARCACPSQTCSVTAYSVDNWAQASHHPSSRHPGCSTMAANPGGIAYPPWVQAVECSWEGEIKFPTPR
jgi:hypothetical protein